MRPATVLTLFTMLLVLLGAARAEAAPRDRAVQEVVARDTVRADSAGADTVVSVPSDTLEPISAQRAGADERTRSELQALFDRVPSFDRLTVHVDAGVVRLEGVVLDAESRRRAIELASSMEDVRFVDTRIRESTSLEEQLRPTWARLRELAYGLVATLPLLVVAIGIVALSVAAGSLMARWRGPSVLQLRNPFLQGLIRRALQAMLIVLSGVLLALDLLGATALVTAVARYGGRWSGLVLGLAFKDIAENYVAGIVAQRCRQPFCARMTSCR
jgi:small conductance mechanosensitive channel